MSYINNLKIRCELCNEEYERLFIVYNIFHFHRGSNSDLRNKVICKNCAKRLFVEGGLIPKGLTPEDRKLLKFGLTATCANCSGRGYDIGRDQFGAYREFDCVSCRGIGYVKLGERYGAKETIICFIIGSAIIYEGMQISSYLVMIIGILAWLLGLIIYLAKDFIPPFG